MPNSGRNMANKLNFCKKTKTNKKLQKKECGKQIEFSQNKPRLTRSFKRSNVAKKLNFRFKKPRLTRSFKRRNVANKLNFRKKTKTNKKLQKEECGK